MGSVQQVCDERPAAARGVAAAGDARPLTSTATTEVQSAAILTGPADDGACCCVSSKRSSEAPSAPPPPSSPISRMLIVKASRKLVAAFRMDREIRGA